jgi:hypothetical protein
MLVESWVGVHSTLCLWIPKSSLTTNDQLGVTMSCALIQNQLPIADRYDYKAKERNPSECLVVSNGVSQISIYISIRKELCRTVIHIASAYMMKEVCISKECSNLSNFRFLFSLLPCWNAAHTCQYRRWLLQKRWKPVVWWDCVKKQNTRPGCFYYTWFMWVAWLW